MSNQENYIPKQIETLDRQITDAQKIIAQMESRKKIDEKIYRVLKAKISDWTAKRNFLLALLLQQIKK